MPLDLQATVEWALVVHPDVVEAAATTVTTESADASSAGIIRAWVVLQPGVEGDAAEAQRLAAHAVEGAGQPLRIEVRFVESLPKTRTGKVARWMLEP